MTQEALKLALDALETELSIDWTNNDEFNTSAEKMYEAIAAIKKALAQTQELVAWMTQARNFIHLSESTEAEAKLYGWKAVYTHLQRTWVGLTKKEVHDLYDADYVVFHQRIEAKLKEKNNG